MQVLVVREPFHLNGVMKQIGDVLVGDEKALVERADAIVESVEGAINNQHLMQKCIRAEHDVVEGVKQIAAVTKSAGAKVASDFSNASDTTNQ